MNKVHSNVDKRISQLPSWLWANSNVLPPIYRLVWEAVREDKIGLGAVQGELLVDTGKVFPLLLTSQLPTEILGYIWSLANQKYAGQLTEQELYVVLALIAIAQASYTFNSLDVLHLVPVPPVPNLNVALLNTRHVVQLKPEQKIQPMITQEPNANTATLDGKHMSQAKSWMKGSASNTSIPGVNSLLSDDKDTNDIKPDTKPGQSGSLPTSSNLTVTLPDVTQDYQVQAESKSQYAVSSTDSSDDFSDFQSAPIPSIPNIPILDTRQGSAIGSRLANHNLGVKKSSEKLKRTGTNRNTHGNNQFRNSTASVNSAICNKGSLPADYLVELFPKCTLKSHGKMVILKDTAIRNSDPSKDSNVNFKDFTNVTEKINPVDDVVSAAHIICNNKITTRKELESNRQDLMNVQPLEDKYSALRILVEEPSAPFIQSDLNVTDASAVDDFGDFVSAEQLDPATLTVDTTNPASSLDFLTDFEFKHDDDTVNGKTKISLIQEISKSFNDLKIEQQNVDRQSEEKFDAVIEADKTIQKEDTVSVNSMDLDSGVPHGLARSGSVPSLDLKSFLTSNQDEDQQAENMCQLIYWEWKQYMESCVLLLQVAANIFTSITSEVVLREVLSTAQGYNFLCNLAEVAAVCRRVNFSHKEMDINIMGFDDLLMDIDRIWTEMEPFYTNIPIVTELPVWPLHQGESITCALCLTVVTSGRVVHNKNSYHVTCANLWLNCINNNLPALYYPTFQSHSTVSLSSSHI